MLLLPVSFIHSQMHFESVNLFKSGPSYFFSYCCHQQHSRRIKITSCRLSHFTSQYVQTLLPRRQFGLYLVTFHTSARGEAAPVCSASPASSTWFTANLHNLASFHKLLHIRRCKMPLCFLMYWIPSSRTPVGKTTFVFFRGIAQSVLLPAGARIVSTTSTPAVRPPNFFPRGKVAGPWIWPLTSV
jgi:hypothetical protein